MTEQELFNIIQSVMCSPQQCEEDRECRCREAAKEVVIALNTTNRKRRGRRAIILY